MSEKRTFRFVHDQARRLAAQFCMTAPEGWMAQFSEPKKTRLQEEKYHAMIGDIAKQMEFCGRLWDSESMKRICVDQFRRDTANDPDLSKLWRDMGTVEMCPSLDGSGVVALGWQTRRFPKRLAIAFIDWLYALGSEKNVKWTEAAQHDQRMAA